MPPKVPVPNKNTVPPARPQTPATPQGKNARAKGNAEKPEAKSKAAPQRKTSTAGKGRGNSKNPKGKVAVVETVEVDTIEVEPKNVTKSVQVRGIEVTSGQNLPRKLLEKLVDLPFVAGYSKLSLQRVSYSTKPPEKVQPSPSIRSSPSLSPGRSQTKGSERGMKSEPASPTLAQFLQAQAQGQDEQEDDDVMLLIAVACGAEPSKPCLLRVGPRELLQEEAEWVPYFREAYGPWCPGEAEMSETNWLHDIMHLPLAGGCCVLPAIANLGAPSDVRSFSRQFGEALSDMDGTAASSALTASELVCSWILAQPFDVCEEDTLNLAQVFNNVDNMIMGHTHPHLGVEYYDGMGSDLVESQLGGPTTDGVAMTELTKIVSDLIPGMKQTRPSQFLTWFHGQMPSTGSKWNLAAWYSKSTAPIDFDCILQDANGQAWLSVCSANSSMPRFVTMPPAENDARCRHVFARLAHWLLSGVLLFAPLETAADQKHLRELCMVLASIPEDNIDHLAPPAPPAEASLHVRFVWSFARRVCRCLRWHTTLKRTSSSGKPVVLGKPGLQMLWALLDTAIEMVPSARTRFFPERKRLALWASVCFAARLGVVSGKIEEPSWLSDRYKLWRAPEDGGLDSEGAAAQVHMIRFGLDECWSTDPVTKQLRSIHADDLPWEILGDKAPSAPNGEGPESAGPTAPTEEHLPEDAKTEDAAASDFPDPEQPGDPKKEAPKTMQALESTMGYLVRKELEQKRRLVITGGLGAGKRSISAGIMAELVTSQVWHQDIFRFPVRMSMEELSQHVKATDALQQHFASCRHLAPASAWERAKAPPWAARSGHQVVREKNRIFVIGGYSTEKLKPLQDAWVSQDNGQTWEELPTPVWPARSGHQVVCWEDKLILLGGVGDEDRRLRDGWQSSDQGETWQELPCPRWSARHGHRAVVVPLQVKEVPTPHLVLMGGNAVGNKACRDVWASDSGGFSWFELDPLPCSPRWNFALTQFRDEIWITGGADEQHSFNDCWIMTHEVWPSKAAGGGAGSGGRRKSNMTVAEPQESPWKHFQGAPWSERSLHQVMPFRGQLAVFGGVTSSGQVLSDAWLSEDGQTWGQLPEHAWAFVADRFGQQAVQLEDSRVLVTGGTGGGRDVFRSRLFSLALEGIDEGLKDTEAVAYLDRLIEHEPGHLILGVSSLLELGDAPMRPGADDEAQDEPPEDSVDSHFRRWGFAELRVKPLEISHLQTLCRQWTRNMPELREQVEAEMIQPDNFDLVNSPLTAITVLRDLVPRSPSDRKQKLTRCQLYEQMFKRVFQSYQALKSHDSKAFAELHKQGVTVAVAELAYEGLGRNSRAIKAHELASFVASLNVKELVEPMEKLMKLAQSGQLLLLEEKDGGLRFRYPSMQDFLAAHCAWQRLLEGKGLPTWLVQENAAGNVSEAVTSCAKFFCLQAEGKEPLKKELLLELREGLTFLLQTMCKAGNALAIRCLLGVAAAGARQQLMAMHSPSGVNQTGLHFAAVHGHKEVVDMLLELAPEPMQLCQAVNADGMAPLHCAARDGHETTARALLKRSSNGLALLQMPQKNSSTLRPLHLAAKHGHVAVVKCFLEYAPNPTALRVESNSAGNTALHFAAAGGHTVCVQAILTHAGPPVALPDRALLLLTAVNRFDRQTALHVAADKGENPVVELLLQLAPDKGTLLAMSDKLGQTALHLASEKGHAAVVQRLLSLVGDTSGLLAARERITGQTALHMAAECGHSQAVHALLKACPYAETSLATDRCGRYTALHLAAERGHLETVRALLQHAPELERLLMAQERFAGQTALHLAAAAGHAALCKVLLEMAPSPAMLLAAKDKSGGFTPLQLACEKGQAEVVEALLEADPERAIRLKDCLDKWSGFSALHLIAYRGHEEAAKALLRGAPDKRAILALKDQRGRTAADLAADRGRRPVASLLADA